METIKVYLENMFAGLPRTSQMSDLKNNILSNMEEKYNELKAAGKSENEAVGIVISEFGNIDELVNELGIKKEEVHDDQPFITREETYSYLAAKKKLGVRISIGVFLCILAVATLILISTLYEDGLLWAGLSEDVGDIIGLIPLFVLITIAVAIFIYSGMNFEKYEYIEKGVNLPAGMRSELQKKYDEFGPTYSKSLIIGVCLLILSPTVLFITSVMKNDMSTYGVVILLCIVAVAVSDFIYFGSIRESYSILLKIGEYTAEKKTENKAISVAAAIVWPLAALVYLFCGFVYNMWGTAWVVFPITGILFGIYCSVCSIVSEKSK
ncbi:MAG TPA: permease prefix domain 1-containing protein [Mobilitalea sp.]|nr:permease prefix domain 1-containing protein [Mobilitalea sp.]